MLRKRNVWNSITLRHRLNRRRAVAIQALETRVLLHAASLADTFSLHSNQGADHTIYLDFDGHVTSGTIWNNFYLGGDDLDTPAFGFSGDESFNDDELYRIQAIWQRVAEDYLPFDVDVTTELPSADALAKNGASDDEWGVRVVIGGNGSWYGNAGGVAFTGSFNWSSDTPVFVFEDKLGSREKHIAEAISHEVGHALSLNHDGRTSPVEEYYKGHGSGATGWAPILGNSYGKELTQWSRGEYPNASNSQDDLAVITANNGFGYRADDHGNSRNSATVLTSAQGSLAAEGIIERNDDADYFRFTTAAGLVTFNADPAERGANLDIEAAILNAAGAVVTLANPIGTLSAMVSATVAAGQYYLRIAGGGQGDLLSGGYSDYGSLGEYSVTGTVIEDGGGGGVTAVNDQITIAEDGSINYDVLANDQFAGSATVSAVTQGAYGTTSIQSNGRIRYTPSADFHGSDSFQYTLSAAGQTATATVNVTVTPRVDVVTDSASTSRNTAVEIDVLANDTFAGATSIASVTQGSNGTVSINADGTIEYSPDTGYVGSDSFTYTVDNTGQHETATVNVSVTAPSTQNPGTIDFSTVTVGSYGGKQDSDSSTAVVLDGGATLLISGNAWKQIAGAYQVTATTVIEFDFRSTSQADVHGLGFANDMSPSNSSGRGFQLYGTQGWANQDFRDYAASAPNWVHYRIPVGEFYTGDFEYLFFLNDHDVANPTGNGYFRNLQIFNSGATNSPPIAAADTFAVAEDSSTVQLDVLANDQTEPNETLTIQSLSAGSAGGTLSIAGGTRINYRPAADFFGTETFTYVINDGTLANDATGSVTVTVQPAADVVDDVASTLAGSPVNINVLANDSFSGSATVVATSDGDHGSVNASGGGTVTYTPEPGFTGIDSFTYTAMSAGVTEQATVTITVNAPSNQAAINFAAVAIDSYGGAQDTADSVFNVLDGGATLSLSGNGWKQIELPYTVTANTVLEFEFRSSAEGDIHAIGFDNDDRLTQDFAFELYGDQNWAIQDFRDYAAPGWQQFTIPVGNFFTGTFAYLFFANDHDVSDPDSIGQFSNVRIYESSQSAVLSGETPHPAHWHDRYSDRTSSDRVEHRHPHAFDLHWAARDRAAGGRVAEWHATRRGDVSRLANWLESRTTPVAELDRVFAALSPSTADAWFTHRSC